jgi:Ca2+-binding RTX toxin-like protein
VAHIRGSRYSDDIYGTDSSDVIEGFEGHDRIWGFGGDDLLIGGSGDDDLDGGAGNDRMEGGTGDDLYVVDSTGDQVVENAGEGIDVVLTPLATYTLGANVEDLVAIADADFHGTGNGLDNYIYGYTGDDTLDGAGGNDVLFGDLGDDVYYIDDSGDEAVEYSGEGYDTVFTSLNALTLAANVEEMIFDGTGAFAGTGNSGDNYIEGGAGNDRLFGLDGDDILNGAAGADEMTGGAGDDIYVVDNGGDQVNEASASGGIDQVESSISYQLGSNVEDLLLTGTGAINGSGNSLVNYIYGNAAANTLDGGAGADYLEGGAGNDVYIVDNAGDRVVETSAAGGVDRVSSSVGFTLGANVENLTLTGTAAINGTGNGLANTITGNSGANTIDGGAGGDTMAGGGGNDLYAVDNSGDRVIEGAGAGTDGVTSAITYTLTANVENLTLGGSGAINGYGNALANALTGNAAANTLSGLDGNDTLSGGGGNDRLFGGNGNDTLSGGAGKDSFFFQSPLNPATNVDAILDFSAADDAIQLSRAIFTAAGPNGTLNPDAFHVGSAAADAEDRIVYNSSTGQLYYDADGSGAGAAMLFATVAAGTPLTNADFVVYG